MIYKWRLHTVLTNASDMTYRHKVIIDIYTMHNCIKIKHVLGVDDKVFIFIYIKVRI